MFKSLLKSMRKGRGGDETPPRQLLHPNDLQVGDIIKFGFAAQAGISNEECMVSKILTYDLGGESKQQTVFIIENEQGNFTLAVIKDKNEESLEIGLSVLPDVVEQVFCIDDFADMLEPDTGVNHVLKRIGEPNLVEGWTSEIYRQEAGHQAYRYQADYRQKLMPDDASIGDGFDYNKLISDDRNFALLVEVYDGGKTDVYLQVRLSLSKIEEMWPA